MLNTLISDSAEYVNEVVIGMAHRGRLNVMLNVLGMPTAELVREFTGDKVMSTSGDVKYHLGYSINRKIAGKLVHVSLAYNPSHLEAIYPVVLGNCRARIDQQDKIATLPILIHGDASLSGQGVVMECLNMAYVPAYRVGGSIHIVVNNQIGFTAEAVDGRSSRYCTDIGKFIGAPVLHVHADYPESVYRCAV
ncbi:MAG: 2-oxoglutarate dehydrogenase E1 component, partial [Gammaproteobacteria bacterium]|nr:2-oxoglutarate dehydrogenase E1 component [Gammaproteobacteria bacterium]